MSDNLPAISDRQTAWLAEYFGACRFNASQAGKAIGVDPSTGRQYKLDPNVQAHIRAMHENQLAAAGITANRTIQEAANLAFQDPTNIITMEDGRIIVRDLNELPHGVRSTISAFKIRRTATRRIKEVDEDGKEEERVEFDEVLEIKFHDKVRALALLGVWLGIEHVPDRGDDTLEFTGVSLNIYKSKGEVNGKK